MIAQQFQATFVLVFISVGMAAAIKTVHRNIAECHSKDIVLDCPPYHRVQADDHSITWLTKLQGGMKWQKLGTLDYGYKVMYRLQGTKASRFLGRIALYSNGSLRISNLEPDDETMYRCEVSAGSRIPFKINVVTLNVSCDGKITESKREVCSEEDAILYCPAKDRTNPRKLSGVRWYRRSRDRRIFLVHANGSEPPKYNPSEQSRIKLHENGSLVVRAGSDGAVAMYICEATKKNGVSTPERHQVTIKSMKCAVEKKPQANGSTILRPCIGDEMTVRCPVLGQVDRSRVRLLKWRSHSAATNRDELLVHVRTRRSGIQNWFLRVDNGSQSSRVRLGPNAELIMSNVKAEDRGTIQCVVKTTHHQTPLRHFTTVWPIKCPQVTETTESERLNTTRAPIKRSSTLKPTTTTTAQALPTTVPTLKDLFRATNGDNGSMRNSTSTSSRLNTTTATTTQQQPERKNISTQRNLSQTVTSSQDVTPKPIKLETTTTHARRRTVPSVVKTTPTSYVKPSVVQMTASTTDSPVAERGYGESVKDGGHSNNASVCGGSLTSLSGKVQSPNFPKGYPANLDCRWTIQGPEHAHYNAIKFSFVKISLEQEQDCLYDYLAFEDALGNQVGCKHCALKKTGSSLIMKGRTAVVIFHSDATVGKTGFYLTYSLL